MCCSDQTYLLSGTSLTAPTSMLLFRLTPKRRVGSSASTSSFQSFSTYASQSKSRQFTFFRQNWRVVSSPPPSLLSPHHPEPKAKFNRNTITRRPKQLRRRKRFILVLEGHLKRAANIGLGTPDQGSSDDANFAIYKAFFDTSMARGGKTGRPRDRWAARRMLMALNNRGAVQISKSQSILMAGKHWRSICLNQREAWEKTGRWGVFALTSFQTPFHFQLPRLICRTQAVCPFQRLCC